MVIKIVRESEAVLGPLFESHLTVGQHLSRLADKISGKHNTQVHKSAKPASRAELGVVSTPVWRMRKVSGSCPRCLIAATAGQGSLAEINSLR